MNTHHLSDVQVLMTCGLILVISFLTSMFGFWFLLNAPGLCAWVDPASAHFSSEHQEIRWRTQRIPLIGGPVLLCTLLLGFNPLIPDLMYTDFGKYCGSLKPDIWWAVLLGSFLVCATGYLDDRFHLSPSLKLCGQVLSTCPLVYLLFVYPVNDPFTWVLPLLMVAGILLLVNSINLLDNMDGTAAFTVLGFFCLALASWSLGLTQFRTAYPDYPDSSDLIPGHFLCAVTGSTIGFLIWNRYPARIYLGDSGSHLLGYWTALVLLMPLFSESITSLHTNSPPNRLTWPALSLWLLAGGMGLLVPLTDTMLVTVFRLRRGISPLIGGRDHLTHHLHYLGIPEYRVGPILAGITLTAGSVGQLTYRSQLVPYPVKIILLIITGSVVVLGLSQLYIRGGKRTRTVAEP